MSGGLVIAYYKEGDTFYLVSGYESNYPSQKVIPAGTSSHDAFAQQDSEWVSDTTKRFVIEKESSPKSEGRYTIRKKVDDKFGFPKGGSKGTETPIETAKREFQEEVGYLGLKDYKLKPLASKSDYTIFTYKITSKPEIGAINKAIADMKEARKGELFEVAFRSIEDIKKMPLNAKSRAALQAFERNASQMGGTRKRKRAKRQTSK
jgi:8-oxo-dGTP pyrophosphatase MutT (NUDIX family)